MKQIQCKRMTKEELYSYIWWNGEKLKGSHIAYDTETELIQSSLHVPNASLAMAYDGEILCLIHPSKLKDFFMQHKQKHFVGHNFAFDFWVTQKIIGGRSLWELADKGYIHDTMILDQLIQLGTGKYRIAGGGFGNSDKVYAAGLGTLSKECNSVELDKGDQYRLRFGELLNLTEEEIKNHPEFIGFISYALPDVIATFDVYIDVKQKAYDLMVKAGYKKKGSKYEIFPNAIEKWGLLSEAIQVRGSISLAQLSREPLKINLEERQKYEDEQRKIIADCYTIIESRNPEIIKRNSAKAKKAVPLSPKLKESTGLPAFNDGVLKIVLQKEADKLRIKAPISDGKKGGISTSTKVWIQYADKSEFIDAWCKLEKHTMLLQFLVKLNHPYIYTAYDLLKKTGRTGSSAHRKTKGSDIEIPSVNIQQMPRDNRLRNLFCKDSEDKKWYICDYGYIELRTLAATCKGRFGFSNLGNVIYQHTRNGGIDPHEKMAAAIAKLSDEQYVQLDKKDRKSKRQAAKSCSFGLPGALGIKKFIDYAKTQYSVIFTEKEAREAKATWLDLYPEMNRHLQDVSLEAVCYNLQVKPSEVRKCFPKNGKWADELRYLRDTLFKWKEIGDKALTEEDIAKLVGLCNKNRPDLIPLIPEPTQWKNLHDEIFLYRASTLTGRVRGKVGYCDGCNSPFQGLASDGGKEALWRLMYLGYNVKMFIHDEIVTSIDAKHSIRDSKRIKEIMITEMEKVIGHNIPVNCEGHIADFWIKE